MNTQKIESLMLQMTRQEKISQLLQLSPDLFSAVKGAGEVTGPMADLGIDAEAIANCGSVLGTMDAKQMIAIQKHHLENNRLKIPLLFMGDVIHGYKTIFPVPLALGSTWNPEVAKQVARTSAIEASLGGLHLTFSPMVDLVRDARWGRVMESTGEDPYLNSLFAKSFVQGYQDTDLKANTSIAACVKHFAAYGAPEGGRDYNTVDMSERIMRQFYFPAYKAAIDAGCQTLMTAFNVVDGMPASGNEWLMREVLRDEWNFKGVTISDWNAIKEMLPHGVARNEKEAAEYAIKAGVDVEMMTACYETHLDELINENVVDETLLNEAVYRILKLKDDLGLFDNPYKNVNIEAESNLVTHAEHRNQAAEVATKSIVLLENDGILPLQMDNKTIALIGPFADNKDVLGPWSWQGETEHAVTLKEGLSKICSNLIYERGCSVDGNESDFHLVLEIADKADVIIVALGEDSLMSGEAGSRTNLELPGKQLELLKTLATLKKPIIGILFNGRPLVLTEVRQYVNALFEAWFPGTEAGTALAKLITGIASPQARLTMSFPYATGQVPIYYNHLNTGRPKPDTEKHDRYVTHYLDCPNTPLYPFGYGLTYTQFEYGQVKVNKEKFTRDEQVIISVDIKNSGQREGTETVQLYIHDCVASVARPVKELKKFNQITLNAGEEKTIEFILTATDLEYLNRKLETAVDNGEFGIYVGPNAATKNSCKIELI
ncbi:MAG: glycoside hydrolase family 3 N-terminal domain-containing protein [Culicoidibacterales bacterium]